MIMHFVSTYCWVRQLIDKVEEGIWLDGNIHIPGKHFSSKKMQGDEYTLKPPFNCNLIPIPIYKKNQEYKVYILDSV